MRRPPLLALAAAAVLATAACGGDDSSTESDAASDATTSEQAPAEAEAAADPTGALINCDSTIDSAAPAFFSTYFRCTDIAIEGDTVVITGPNLPPHLSYYYGEDSPQFEPFDFSRGEEYRPNPNEIAQQTFTIRIPLDPVESGTTVDDATVNLSPGDATDYPFGTAGVALDGVALFNPLAAPGDDIEDEKFTFDSNEGHPQQRGPIITMPSLRAHSRCSSPSASRTNNTPGEVETELYGIMCDGTVVMGMRELDGSTANSGVDAQSGHVHDIDDASGATLLANRYHIHMAPTIGASPRGLTPEAQYYGTCDVSAR